MTKETNLKKSRWLPLPYSIVYIHSFLLLRQIHVTSLDKSLLEETAIHNQAHLKDEKLSQQDCNTREPRTKSIATQLCIWVFTLENLISVLTRTTLHYKIPPQHGLIGYLHAQCHPRRVAPRLPKFFENVPNFKVFTVPKLKTNQIVFFNQKSILFKKWGICCIFGIFPQNAPWYRSNWKSTWTRLLATYTMPCHSGIPLEHAY